MQVNVRRKRHSSCMNLGNLVPSHLVRTPNLDLPVEPSGRLSAGSIALGLLVAPTNDNVPSRSPFHPSDDRSCATTRLSLPSDFLSFGRYCVHLVDED